MYFIHQMRKFQIRREVFVKRKYAKAVIFLSGTGTNAEKLLSSPSYGREWHCCAIVTDRPEKSRARLLAEQYGIPLVEEDIFRFYAEHGLSKISIATEEGYRVRQLWTDALRKRLAVFQPDFGLLAGFVPLTNIVGDFPCLNVHPGDLTVKQDGKRMLTGLHTLPVRKAILAGFDHLRSSVLIATPFTPGAPEMDHGHIPGISARIPVDLCGHPLEELRENGGLLEEVAAYNLETLKRAGDWDLFPRVAADFAAGRFGESPDGTLTYDGHPVRTVDYSEAIPKPLYLTQS